MVKMHMLIQVLRIVTVAPEDMFDPNDATVKAYTRVFLKAW